jgi:hypothetical protein
MTNTYPKTKMYKIIWKESVTENELKILLKEWEGYFEVKQA